MFGEVKLPSKLFRDCSTEASAVFVSHNVIILSLPFGWVSYIPASGRFSSFCPSE
jgi:hypothetical protein